MEPDSNISIKIDDKDLGRALRFDNDKLPDGFKYQSEKHKANIKSNMKDIVVKKPYLTVRCVNTSYLPYIGEILCNNFGTYDKALNLVLGGNIKVIKNDLVEHYIAMKSKKEMEMGNEPIQTWEEPDIEYSFLYLFRDGEWLYKKCQDCGKTWHKLSDCLLKNRETG